MQSREESSSLLVSENEFLLELKRMKTFDFWHEFLRRECQRKNIRIKPEEGGGESAEEEGLALNQTMSSMATIIHNRRPEMAEQNQNRATRTAPAPVPCQEHQEQEEEEDEQLQQQFSSSSFFDRNLHPTIRDQVFLCRQIAKQLVCDESNAKSKGREMFEKRVQKSSKWITTTTTTADDGRGGDNDEQSSEQSFHETTISDGPPNLRLLLDPRHVQDLNSLAFESNETETMKSKKSQEKSRDLSQQIVNDLSSPEIHPKNRGNALFAKRQQKSEEWVVKEAILESAHNLLRIQAEEEEMRRHEMLDTNRMDSNRIEQYSAEQSILEPNINITSSSSHQISDTDTGLGLGLKRLRFSDFNRTAKPFVRMY